MTSAEGSSDTPINPPLRTPLVGATGHSAVCTLYHTMNTAAVHSIPVQLKCSPNFFLTSFCTPFCVCSRDDLATRFFRRSGKFPKLSPQDDNECLPITKITLNSQCRDQLLRLVPIPGRDALCRDASDNDAPDDAISYNIEVQETHQEMR